jgi:hypothetical protein
MAPEAIAEARSRDRVGKSAYETSRSISLDVAAPITGPSADSELPRFIENPLIADAGYDRVLAMQPPPKAIASGLPLTYPDPSLPFLRRAPPNTPTASTFRPAYAREKQGYFVYPALFSEEAA